MTADEIRAFRENEIGKYPDTLNCQHTYLTAEIAAQLAQLNVTLERLARAVEQSLPTPTCFRCQELPECDLCERVGHETRNCPSKSR